MKKVLKIVGGIVLALILVIALALGYFTIREYRPEPVENIAVSGEGTQASVDQEFRILSYNIGYAGLDKSQDFFMDGGTKVNPQPENVRRNLDGIKDILLSNEADVYFLQEVDRKSKRTSDINELEFYEEALGMPSVFANNFKCDFVPYPLPPIGRIDSGIATMSDLKMSEASRISLPESFSWPVKTCNLKRCMLETRIPLENSEKELVLINFHLEAYDSGEGKIAQSKMLAEKMEEEYLKGNYVIAGGDFNQTFEGMDTYPITVKDGWVPGTMSNSDLADGFSFAHADNAPTCRLLNAPYTGNYEDSQVYVIDGFIVSDNIEIQNIVNIDTDFEFTDHQPVSLTFTLK